jgi:2-oxoglutarate ferredoxin oxidoreductase subunit beta
MRPLGSIGHDPANRLAAMALAQDYGRVLHTGVFYRDPEPAVPLDVMVGRRQAALRSPDAARERILDLFAVR